MAKTHHLPNLPGAPFGFDLGFLLPRVETIIGWKERFVTDNALSRIITEIRQLIGDDGDEPRYIETIPKRVHRFIAEVTNVKAATLTTGSGKAAPATPFRAARRFRLKAGLRTIF